MNSAPHDAVIGFAQVLLRQRSATLGVQQDMVQRILNNGNLLALINDIRPFQNRSRSPGTQTEEFNPQR